MDVMRWAKLFAFGLSVVCAASFGRSAGADGDHGAASGRIIDLRFLVATPDEGAVVLVAGTEIGATEARFRGADVLIPVAGKIVRTRGPFDVAAGTDRLLITMGERLGEFDQPFFVTAVFLPADGGAAPYVIAAPHWVPFLSRGEFLVPDQEDSPALTYPGRGFRVLAGRAGDDSLSQVPARRGRRSR